MPTTATGQAPRAGQPAQGYQRTFPGSADQVGRARHEVARYVAGCPAADDAIMIVSELAANAVLHTRSAGQCFTIRCELFRDYVWVECEDLGGQWHRKAEEDRPHGLTIINAVAGEDNWGIDGDATGRVVWARLAW